MVNVIIIFGCLIFIGICAVFVMQALNRQEMITQRDDIEMIRFRLKTINSELEELLGIIKAEKNVKETEIEENVRTEQIGETGQLNVRLYNDSVDEKSKENYGFKTQPANIAPKRDDKIEYEEENFIIEEE